jgi:hypothetical protein
MQLLPLVTHRELDTSGVSVLNHRLVNLYCAFGPDGVLRRHKDVYWFGRNVPMSSRCCCHSHKVPGTKGTRNMVRGTRIDTFKFLDHQGVYLLGTIGSRMGT